MINKMIITTETQRTQRYRFFVCRENTANQKPSAISWHSFSTS